MGREGLRKHYNIDCHKITIHRHLIFKTHAVNKEALYFE